MKWRNQQRNQADSETRNHQILGQHLDRRRTSTQKKNTVSLKIYKYVLVDSQGTEKKHEINNKQEEIGVILEDVNTTQVNSQLIFEVNI